MKVFKVRFVGTEEITEETTFEEMTEKTKGDAWGHTEYIFIKIENGNMYFQELFRQARF